MTKEEYLRQKCLEFKKDWITPMPAEVEYFLKNNKGKKLAYQIMEYEFRPTREDLQAASPEKRLRDTDARLMAAFLTWPASASLATYSLAHLTKSQQETRAEAHERVLIEMSTIT